MTGNGGNNTTQFAGGNGGTGCNVGVGYGVFGSESSKGRFAAQVGVAAGGGYRGKSVAGNGGYGTTQFAGGNGGSGRDIIINNGTSTDC